MSDDNKAAFEQAGAEAGRGLMAELWAMMRQNKKYWLLPIVLVLVVLGVLIILGSTAAAPFIYTLF